MGTVEYSKADNCLHGKVMGMKGILINYEGDTLDELRKDFEDGIDTYLEDCKDEGIEPRKPFSGSLHLRIPFDLHCRIAEVAEQAGLTINSFVTKTLEKSVRLAR